MAAKKKAKKTMKAAPKAPKAAAKTVKVAAKAVHKPGPIPAASRPRTKSDILAVLADQTGLSRKDVGNVFASLSTVIGNDVGKKGPGIFTVPGLLKITRVSKPATKARKGINPFTGQEIVFKAKPARSVVKVRPLKGLKEMVK